MKISESAGDRFSHALLLNVRADVLHCSAGPETSLEAYEALVTLSRSQHNPQHEIWGLTGCGETLLSLERPEAAEPRLREVLVRLDEADPLSVIRFWAVWCTACARLGRSAEAAQALDQFLQAWNQADRKAVLLQELEGHGVLIDALALEVGKDLDPFDMLLYVAWNMPPLTRRERANRVKKRNVFTSYGPVARQVLDALIDKYADQGIRTIESDDILTVPPLNTLGSPVELVRSFGGRPQFLSAIKLLETELYSHRSA
jgi:thiol-disulfide isomerase/thioredoxin